MPPSMTTAAPTPLDLWKPIARCMGSAALACAVLWAVVTWMPWTVIGHAFAVVGTAVRHGLSALGSALLSVLDAPHPQIFSGITWMVFHPTLFLVFMVFLILGSACALYKMETWRSERGAAPALTRPYNRILGGMLCTGLAGLFIGGLVLVNAHHDQTARPIAGQTEVRFDTLDNGFSRLNTLDVGPFPEQVASLTDAQAKTTSFKDAVDLANQELSEAWTLEGTDWKQTGVAPLILIDASQKVVAFTLVLNVRTCRDLANSHHALVATSINGHAITHSKNIGEACTEAFANTVVARNRPGGWPVAR
jgi:hypothetical protein